MGPDRGCGCPSPGQLLTWKRVLGGREWGQDTEGAPALSSHAPRTPEPPSHVRVNKDSVGPQPAPQSPQSPPGTPASPTVQVGCRQGGCRRREAGGSRGQPARSCWKPASPLSPPAPITKGPLPTRLLFNHFSPLSIKAIFKVNCLLPSTAKPTQLQQHRPSTTP